MSPGIDDILGNFQPKGNNDPRMLEELQRIRNAVELCAALAAHEFFKGQSSVGAMSKLQVVIQRNAARLSKST
jgi:hypothetical protein